MPHYFGIGVIGVSTPDDNSTKNDFYCKILNYKEFKEAVPAKIKGEYLEIIPESRKNNYWRFGVREVSASVYDSIISISNTLPYIPELPSGKDGKNKWEMEEADSNVKSNIDNSDELVHDISNELKEFLKRNKIYSMQALLKLSKNKTFTFTGFDLSMKAELDNLFKSSKSTKNIYK